MSIVSFVWRHRFVCLGSFIAGLVSIAPYLLAQLTIGGDYEGVPFFFQANEDFYLARVHEIFDGHGFVASPFLYEYKAFFPLVLPFGEYLYAFLALLLPLSLPHVLVFSKFLFPATLYVLIFLAIRILLPGQNSRTPLLTALCGASCVVMGIGLFDYNDVLHRMFNDATWSALSIWTRPVNPITGALFLFTFLILLALEQRSIRAALGAGVFLTSMTGYIFSFGVAGAVLFALWCRALMLKDHERMVRLTIVGAIPLAFLSVYAFVTFPFLGEGALGRNGVLLGHAPLVNKMTFLALAIILLCWWWARKNSLWSLEERVYTQKSLWFSLSLVFGSLIALNQQVLTGISIWPYHLVQYTVPLAVVAVLVVGALSIGVLYPRIWHTLMYTGIGVSVLFSAWNVPTYAVLLDQFRDMQRYAPVFSWLNNNAEHDCVVLTAEDEHMRFTNLVPGFTGCNTYHTLHSSGPIPMERIEHNYFVQLRLRGVTADDIDSYLLSHKDEVLTRYHQDWHELFAPAEGNERIASLIPSISQGYRAFIERDFLNEIKRYRADYLVDVGELFPSLPEVLNAQKVLERDGISIYTLPIQ